MSDELRYIIAPWCAALGFTGLGVTFIAAVIIYIKGKNVKT